VPWLLVAVMLLHLPLVVVSLWLAAVIGATSQVGSTGPGCGSAGHGPSYNYEKVNMCSVVASAVLLIRALGIVMV
jgi:hypothetical protein